MICVVFFILAIVLSVLWITSSYYFYGIFLIQGARVAQWVRSLDLTAHTSLSQIRRGFAPSFVNNKKRCTRLAAASDKVYQLLAQGRWFSPGTPDSSTTKTGRHDILLKVALKHQKINQSINQWHVMLGDVIAIGISGYNEHNGYKGYSLVIWHNMTLVMSCSY